jgi:predicted dehydrogenase
MHDVCNEPVTTEISLPREQVNHFDAKIRDFVDAIKENRPAPIPTKEIIYNQAIIDAMIRSAKERREIKIDIPSNIF